MGWRDGVRRVSGERAVNREDAKATGFLDWERVPRSVLIVGGSPEGVSPRIVGRIAPRVAHTVAVDRGLDVVLEAGAEPDLFCGDADSVSAAGAALVRAAEAAAAAGDEPRFAVERYNPHKDYTDLSLALRAVRERWGAVPLVCCGLGGGRPDHLLGVLGCLAGWPGPVFFAEDAYRGRVLHVGERWEPGGSPGARFSFVPLSSEAEVSLAGLRWCLDHARVGLLSDLGISNVVEVPEAAITCHAGTVVAWLFE